MTMLGLTVLPAVQKEEGLLGYLYRLANANALCGSEVLAAYRANGETDTPPDTPHHWRAEAEELLRPGTSPVRLWAHRAIRFCPRCLADGAFWRASWHLSLYTCCTHHKLELLERCPACNETLTHSAMSTLDCERCHTSLDKMHAAQPSAQPGALVVAHELETRLLKLRKLRRSVGGQLNLVDFHEVALRLGIRGCPTSRTKPMKPAKIGALSIAGPIAEQAGQALHDWPRGFMRLLDSIRCDRKCEQTWRIARAMGPIYDDIYKNLPAPQFDFIRTAFEAYVRDHWQVPVALRNRNLSQELIEKHRWISREDAAHALGIDTPLVDYLVDSGQMQCRENIYSSGRRVRVVNANIAETLLERLREAITLAKAADLLAIGKTRTRQLVTAGVLKTFGGKPRQGGRWWLDSLSLEQLRAVPRLSTPPEAPVSPVAQIARHLAMTGSEFSEMTRAISDGSLRVFSPANALAPFGAWLLEERQIRAWRAHRHPTHAGMSVTQAAQALGIKQEVAYSLVRLGLLRAEAASHANRRSQIVSAASLNSFRRSYVFGPELAALLDADPRGLSKKLKSQGLKPVAGPTLPDALCRQYVWQRKVIAKLQLHNYLKA